MHTQISLQVKMPKLIWFSSARTHDRQFLKRLLNNINNGVMCSISLNLGTVMK